MVRSRAFLCGSLLATAITACTPPPRIEHASSPAPSRAAPPAATAARAPTAAPRCELVCAGATVVRHEITPDESADYYTTEAVDRANQTLNTMHDDLLACYESRVKVSPKAHAFLTVDIVVGAEGHVQAVETQGGALLGKVTMSCIVDRIKQGEFARPPHGGTMRFEVPLTLRRMGADETI